MDRNIGGILRWLKDHHLRQETILVLVSDNGGYIGDYEGSKVTSNRPLRSGKGSLYEGGIRVPMVIVWPGVTEPGRVIDTPVITNDLYPTLIDMTAVGRGSGYESTMDGISLVPILKDPKKDLSARALYWHYPHYYSTTSPVSAIRKGPWKLLEYHGKHRLELYHLGRDISETNDLSSARSAVAARLHQQLEKWRRRVDAQMPRKDSE